MASTADYWVGVTIGEGSFGVTLHGVHKATEYNVAIKVVDKCSLYKHPAWLHSVKTEQRVLRKLHEGPYIVKLWSSFHDAECIYLVMECCLGGNLAQAIRHGLQHQPQHWICSRTPHHYARQVWEGLRFIHANKIIHGDLKPDNILLSGQGMVQIADFGAAVDITFESATSPASAVGVEPQRPFLLQGSTDYASPEVLRGCPVQELSPAADLWSFGCILFALCMGQSPFTAPSEALVVERVLDYCQEADASRRREGRLFHGSAAVLEENWKLLIARLLDPNPLIRLDDDNHEDQGDTIRFSPLWELVDLGQPPGILPPEPSWLLESRGTTMRDGGLGWGVFLL